MSRIPAARDDSGEGGSAAGRERTYAGKTRRQRRSERQRQMLDAGLQLFGTRGYRRTTIEQLCSEAGVGLRAFYQEFGSRDALFRAVYDDVATTAYAGVERELAAVRDDPSDVRLATCIRLLLESVLVDPRRARVVSIESSALDERMDRHRNDTMKRFAALIADMLDPAARAVVGDPTLWSLMVGGALNEIVISRIVSPDARPLPDLAAEVAATWVRTIQP